MSKTTYSISFALFVTLFALIGCSPAGQEQSVDDNAPANATAVYIDELEILIMESFPVQVSAVVRGNLADGCVTLNGLNPVADMGNWVIEIDSSRDTDTMCTEALVPFEEIVPLDVLGLPAGTYTVTAGEQSATYTLDMDNRVSDVLPSEVEITLERTACFGTCPVYTLTIYGDGMVVFTGTDFVEYTGEQTSLLSIDAVYELVGAFVEAGYLDWEDAYTNREVTDLPTVITSIAVDGEFKRIEHYLGDSSAPKALTALEDLTDATVNSSQWIGQSSIGMANPASVNCDEVGGRIEMRNDGDGNQYGVCIFDDGSECEEWALFNGKCEPGNFSISWEMATDLVRGGFVNTVFQAHDQSVEFALKDGRSLTTSEPQIDDIFTLVEECGDDCSDILMATE